MKYAAFTSLIAKKGKADRKEVQQDSRKIFYNSWDLSFNLITRIKFQKLKSNSKLQIQKTNSKIQNPNSKFQSPKSKVQYPDLRTDLWFLVSAQSVLHPTTFFIIL